jgi:hypothetical protein
VTIDFMVSLYSNYSSGVDFPLFELDVVANLLCINREGNCSSNVWNKSGSAGWRLHVCTVIMVSRQP